MLYPLLCKTEDSHAPTSLKRDAEIRSRFSRNVDFEDCTTIHGEQRSLKIARIVVDIKWSLRLHCEADMSDEDCCRLFDVAAL